MATKAAAASAVEPQMEEQAPEKVVRYKHDYPFQSRELAAEDFHKAGLSAEREDIKLVRWGPENNWTVPVSELGFLTDEEFQRFIEGDTSLEVGDR